MSKILLLFIQISTVDAYVNVITHCVKHEDVKRVHFVGKEVLPGEETGLEEFILEIYKRLDELSSQNINEYRYVREYLPPRNDIETHITRIDFLRPHTSLPKIRALFPKAQDVIVDITGTSKQLAIDVMTSFVASGYQQVCHFVLHDKVYSSAWEKTKLYHDVVNDEGIRRYTYVNC